jgi:hypothetical protein
MWPSAVFRGPRDTRPDFVGWCPTVAATGRTEGAGAKKEILQSVKNDDTAPETPAESQEED